MTTTSKDCVVKRRGNTVTLLLNYPPVPASRPRVTRWGTYYLKTYKAYKDFAEQAIPCSTKPPLTGNIQADILFVCAKPKTTKRINPRGDIDNHEKSILDAITGTKKQPKGYWLDDDQINLVTRKEKRWAEQGETPHTRITFKPHIP